MLNFGFLLDSTLVCKLQVFSVKLKNIDAFNSFFRIGLFSVYHG